MSNFSPFYEHIRDRPSSDCEGREKTREALRVARKKGERVGERVLSPLFALRMSFRVIPPLLTRETLHAWRDTMCDASW